MTARSGLHRFYPIVPDAGWLARIVPIGVKLVQLRMKDVSDEAIRQGIRAGLAVCRAHDCQLIVNDYWRQALDEGADYVHLGQEDLADADLAALRRAGVRLGLSTHDAAELQAALDAGPDYIALGPIYPTTLKAMRFGPQGLQRITNWKRRAGVLPLVAIGGISLERAPDVLAHGADSIAVVSDVTANADPEARVRAWLTWAAAAAPAR